MNIKFKLYFNIRELILISELLSWKIYHKLALNEESSLSLCLCLSLSFFFLTQGYVLDFRERELVGWRGETGRQTDRQTLISFLPYVPPPGIEPTVLVYTLTRNRTRNLLVYRMVLQPSNPPYQGMRDCLFKLFII